MTAPTDQQYLHDVFISHASEDKEDVARPLAKALTKRGWTVWLDELQLTVGDTLARRIDQALARSRFGVVILSHSFFAKQWPQRELAGLTTKEVQTGTKVILPVWHEVSAPEIAGYSPILADRLGVSTGGGIDHVADELSRALEEAQTRPNREGPHRLLKAVPARSTGSPRKVRRSGLRTMSVLSAAAVAAAISFSVMAFLPSAGRDSDATIRIGEASAALPPGWRPEPLSPADRAAGMEKEAQSPSQTVLFGVMPPGRLGFPAPGQPAFTVHIGARIALRADWVKGLHAQRAYAFPLGNAYLVVACRASNATTTQLRRSCAEIAASVRTPKGHRPEISPSPRIQMEVADSLGDFERASRRASSELAEARTQPAVAEVCSEAAASVRNAAEFARSDRLSALRAGISGAASAWATAASAARRGSPHGYAQARKKLRAAERQIERSQEDLLRLGYRK